MEAFDVRGKRRYPRKQLHRRVGVLAAGLFFTGTTLDLGEGGLSFETDYLLEQGHVVVVSFQIPGGDFLSVRALVRFTQKNGALAQHGLSFENIPFYYKRQIRTFVAAVDNKIII